MTMWRECVVALLIRLDHVRWSHGCLDIMAKIVHGGSISCAVLDYISNFQVLKLVMVDCDHRMLRYMAGITGRDRVSRKEVARCGLKELNIILSKEILVFWVFGEKRVVRHWGAQLVWNCQVTMHLVGQGRHSQCSEGFGNTGHWRGWGNWHT